MLEKIDLTSKLSRVEYSRKLKLIWPELGSLQREIKAKAIPVLILFEGWETSGKGTTINNLILPLDPRGFKVFTMAKASEEELFRPYLWRFCKRLPSAGRFAIFDRSWYKLLIDEGGPSDEREISLYLNTLSSFEKLLFDSETVIIKFFLHIGRQEQKKRLKRLSKDPATAWRVSDKDFKQNENYEEVRAKTERILQASDIPCAPWYLIPATDRRFAAIQIMETVRNSLKKALERENVVFSPVGKWSASSSILNSLNLSKKISKNDYGKRLEKAQNELREYQYLLYKKRRALVVVFEGVDAAGKGGSIRRLTERLDPRGYEVIPIGAPNDTERSYHYLWRFWINMPKDGHIAIFDRSWYGRVLVERVEGFASEHEWSRAFREINDMEEQLHNHGVMIAKFWLHIDQDEQLKRFKAREEDERKNWKITPEDWRNREKWELYKPAIEEMLIRTGTTYAPWTIIESNDKRYSRVKVLETLTELLKRNL
ncbi:MAG TPA: polyphosphate:AMP phosphotransferase [Mesotoga infera]|nr:polyphosphate:AMP phosphotransferase [Mesotoga sp.]HON29326.1 polyphosphate:AMP phosphotransferase [Mesotoga infera]HPD38820.1 polyphosphate:AMP phosphotransferase [Mesotoga infera]HRV02350.1 polyphosphate:AMP phosphotransferase [Mesotoga sp.]